MPMRLMSLLCSDGVASATGRRDRGAGAGLDLHGLRQRTICIGPVAKSGGWPRIAGRAAIIAAAPRGRAPSPASSVSGVYDEATTQAVRAFQRRHGIEPDSRLGASTLATQH
jgi:peptidoglycan hydrolase-like protein with peptidoglycan-binding domain